MAQANLELGLLRPLEVLIPSLAERRRIASYLDGIRAKVQKIKREQERTQAELYRRVPSVLPKVLQGQL